VQSHPGLFAARPGGIRPIGRMVLPSAWAFSRIAPGVRKESRPACGTAVGEDHRNGDARLLTSMPLGRNGHDSGANYAGCRLT
jgi:hypothetical protein